MSMADRRSSLSASRCSAWSLLVLGLLFFVIRGYQDERSTLQSFDFKQPYASARCLLKGCDPYNEASTRAAFLRAHGTGATDLVFAPYSALYPPFSLATLSPLAALPYGVAHMVWKALIAAGFSVAVLLTADLCFHFEALPAVALLAFFTADSTILLMEGQISGVSISLLTVGFWLLLRRRSLLLAVVCFVLAFALKPNDAAIPLLYLLFAQAPWRKVFVVVAAASLAVVLAGTLWCAHEPGGRNWMPELAADLAGNEGVGAVNYPGRGNPEAIQTADLQGFTAAFDGNPPTYNAVAALASLALLMLWAYPAYRMRDSLQKHVLALASISCIMLLPIYHRQYDTRIFVLLFPAAALLWQWRRRTWGAACMLLLAAMTFCTSHQFLHRVQITQDASIRRADALKTALCYRPLPEIETLLALFFLGAFYAVMRAQRRVEETEDASEAFSASI